MTLKKHHVESLLYSITVFFILFIGNFEFYGFRVFYTSLVAAFFIVIFSKVSVSKFSLFVFTFIGFFSIVFSFLSVDASHYIDGYNNWPFQLLVSFTIMYFVMSNILLVHGKTTGIIYFFIFFIFISAIFVLGEFDGGRVSFIFGPNVLYRVVSFLVVFCIFYLLFFYQSFKLSFLLFLFYFLGLFFVGSRGGLISGLIVLAIFLHYKLGKFGLKELLIFSLLALIGFLMMDYFLVDSRLINYDTTDDRSSVGIRYSVILYTINNFWELVFSSGMSYQDYYENFYTESFVYPHNIFVELIMFFGFFGFVLSIFLLLALFNLSYFFLTKNLDFSHVYFYSILCLLPGLMFSGDLNDNAGVVGALLANFVLRKTIFNNNSVLIKSNS